MEIRNHAPAVSRFFDGASGRDGIDTLTSVELQSSNLYLMAMTGIAGSPINVSGLNSGGNNARFELPFEPSAQQRIGESAFERSGERFA